MVKYAIIYTIKMWYFEYRYHETHFCTRMDTIEQPKKICNNINILTLVMTDLGKYSLSVITLNFNVELKNMTILYNNYIPI